MEDRNEKHKGGFYNCGKHLSRAQAVTWAYLAHTFDAVGLERPVPYKDPMVRCVDCVLNAHWREDVDGEARLDISLDLLDRLATGLLYDDAQVERMKAFSNMGPEQCRAYQEELARQHQGS